MSQKKKQEETITTKEVSRSTFIKGGLAGLLLTGVALSNPMKAVAAEIPISDNLGGEGGGGTVGPIAPHSTKGIWIDTSIGGVTKYHNGTAWVPVKQVWSD